MVSAFLDIFRTKRPREPRIDPALPASEIHYIVLDTELTGLDEKKDSVLSVGALRMNGTRIELGTFFSRKMNPARELNPRSVVVHGVTPSEVEREPDQKPILNEFRSFCGDAVLVGHCIALDLSFLNKALNRFGIPELDNPSIDTYALAELLVARGVLRTQLHGISPSEALFALAKEFGIAVTSSHDALGDAYITSQIFQRMLVVSAREGIHTIGELLQAGTMSGGDSEKRPAGQFTNF
ncbi:MAG TPA: 3'-5' exonuclease [Dissulfurispiraceae bacterium]|nr:3'-5' exonuclease [Dissulfurispiraceae bacterium]